jgi:DNA replication protein DnaC
MFQAVGQELIRRGHRMLFTSCEMLVQELLIAKRDLKLSRLIKKHSRYEGMISDDLGYIRQIREEMEVVFTLLAERYERGSVLLTSNLPFSKWGGIFKDPMTTAVAIDRLVHHSIIVELTFLAHQKS